MACSQNPADPSFAGRRLQRSVYAWWRKEAVEHEITQDDVILDARGDIDEKALTTSRMLEAELTSQQQHAQFGGPWGDN